jgi:hypothetical protein
LINLKISHFNKQLSAEKAMSISIKSTPYLNNAPELAPPLESNSNVHTPPATSTRISEASFKPRMANNLVRSHENEPQIASSSRHLETGTNTPTQSGSAFHLLALQEEYRGEEKIKFHGKPWFVKKVKYLSVEQRKAFELHVKDGLLMTAQGRTFETLTPSTANKFTDRFQGRNIREGSGIFVMSSDGKIYAARKKVSGRFHHSSFLSGQEVAAAGRLCVVGGELIFTAPKSGHYKPSQAHFDQFLKKLDELGVSGFSVIHKMNQYSTSACNKANVNLYRI